MLRNDFDAMDEAAVPDTSMHREIPAVLAIRRSRSEAIIDDDPASRAKARDVALDGLRAEGATTVRLANPLSVPLTCRRLRIQLDAGDIGDFGDIGENDETEEAARLVDLVERRADRDSLALVVEQAETLDPPALRALGRLATGAGTATRILFVGSSAFPTLLKAPEFATLRRALAFPATERKGTEPIENVPAKPAADPAQADGNTPLPPVSTIPTSRSVAPPLPISAAMVPPVPRHHSDRWGRRGTVLGVLALAGIAALALSLGTLFDRVPLRQTFHAALSTVRGTPVPTEPARVAPSIPPDVAPEAPPAAMASPGPTAAVDPPGSAATVAPAELTAAMIQPEPPAAVVPPPQQTIAMAQPEPSTAVAPLESTVATVPVETPAALALPEPTISALPVKPPAVVVQPEPTIAAVLVEPLVGVAPPESSTATVKVEPPSTVASPEPTIAAVPTAAPAPMVSPEALFASPSETPAEPPTHPAEAASPPSLPNALAEARRNGFLSRRASGLEERVAYPRLRAVPPAHYEGGRVVVHYSAASRDGEAAANHAAGLASALSASVGLRVVPRTPPIAQIRYFHREDEEQAYRLSNALRRVVAVWEVRNFASFRPSPSPGSIEVWMPAH